MDLLQGITVVEAANYMSGPFGGLVLADLGAEVVKVEPPPRGDPFRTFGRRVDGRSVPFATTNRGKRSVTIDLKTAEGRDELHDLLHRADILITNWRPGVAEELGLVPDDLRQRHPQLVWIRMSGFGQTGPLRERATYDPLIQARTGITVAQGDGEPEMIRHYFADKTAALYGVQVALAALLRRSRTGQGAVVDLAMLDAITYHGFPDVLVDRALPSDTGPRRPPGMSRPIRTSDGWMLVSPVSGKQTKAALVAVGHPEWVEELKQVTEPAESVGRLCDLLESETRHRSLEECEALFVAADVPCSPVFDADQHLADPQVEHNRLYLLVDDPVLGPMRRVRYPVTVDGVVDVDPGRPAPA